MHSVLEELDAPGAPAPLRVLDLRASAAASTRFSLHLLHELDPLIDELERLAELGEVSGLVVRLGSPGGAAPDLDLIELSSLVDMQAARVWSQEGQRVLRRIETLPIPTVAVIRGGCFCGALQVALACGHRVAAADPETHLGFPGLRIGLLPGWGGSVRLGRLIGVRAALELMLAGSWVSARRARALGLVDDLGPARDIEAYAARIARRTPRSVAGSSQERRGFAVRVLEDTAPGRRFLFARVLQRIRGSRELPGEVADRLVQGIGDAVGLPLDAAFAAEVERFATLLTSGPVRGRLHAQLLRTIVAPQPPIDSPATPPVRRVAVLGAASRGALLAALCSSAGIAVKLKDIDRGVAARGLSLVHMLLGRGEPGTRIRQRDIDESMSRVTVASGFGGFGRVEVLLEAVTEDAETKRRVLWEAEGHVSDGCLVAVTSPLIGLAELESALRDPSRLIGLHLPPLAGRASPAEVVRGVVTSDATIARAFVFARQIGRVPVLLRDRPGGVLLRMTLLYLAHAESLVHGGVPPGVVDLAMREFGMPIGPLELSAALGRQPLVRASRLLSAQLGDRFLLAEHRPVSVLAPAPGAGSSAARRTAALSLRATRRLVQPRDPASDPPRLPDSEIRARILLALINEAARILDEDVVDSAPTLDLTLNMGFGIPEDRGGLLFWADTLGMDRIRAELDRLAEAEPHFAPAPSIIRMMEERRGFYGRAAPGGTMLDRPLNA
jgi:3-hydroxyacyl-CoA dehydrogenase / enoyl-CoA hydratase / 3-hydroxybutyryl-CoA epimerase